MRKAKINKSIGVIGCGNMGGAIVRSLINAKIIPLHKIYVFDIDAKKVKQFKNKVIVSQSVENVVRNAEIVILAVKPQNCADVTLSKSIKSNTICVSILAGITIKKLHEVFGKKAKIVRCMPNLGLMVGEGMSAICANRKTTSRELTIIEDIFNACGETVRISENLFDAVTAVSGSGPAYYFYLNELLINEAIKHGIKREKAKKIIQKTAQGAIAVLRKGEDPEKLRQKVTSRGGTTEAAFKVLLKKEFKRLFSQAIDNAIKRGKALRT